MLLGYPPWKGESSSVPSMWRGLAEERPWLVKAGKATGGESVSSTLPVLSDRGVGAEAVCV